MISFDTDSQGVNLTPIYNSLSIINNEIADLYSRISTLTPGSQNYLESYDAISSVSPFIMYNVLNNVEQDVIDAASKKAYYNVENDFSSILINHVSHINIDANRILNNTFSIISDGFLKCCNFSNNNCLGLYNAMIEARDIRTNSFSRCNIYGGTVWDNKFSYLANVICDNFGKNTLYKEMNINCNEFYSNTIYNIDCGVIKHMSMGLNSFQGGSVLNINGRDMAFNTFKMINNINIQNHFYTGCSFSDISCLKENGIMNSINTYSSIENLNQDYNLIKQCSYNNINLANIKCNIFEQIYDIGTHDIYNLTCNAMNSNTLYDFKSVNILADTISNLNIQSFTDLKIKARNVSEISISGGIRASLRLNYYSKITVKNISTLYLNKFIDSSMISWESITAFDFKQIDGLTSDSRALRTDLGIPSSMIYINGLPWGVAVY